MCPYSQDMYLVSSDFSRYKLFVDIIPILVNLKLKISLFVKLIIHWYVWATLQILLSYISENSKRSRPPDSQ